LVRADSSKPIEFMPRTGMVVGVMPEATWEAASMHVDKGDFIVIYSDGITEAQNDAGQDFGLARLVIEAEGMRGRPPTEVRQHLIDVVQAFSGSYQEDDITLLVLGKASED
jgi:sigma-B regulation protein RsbU (phosphoserine phosphatase)